jgi:hypothetical protein
MQMRKTMLGLFVLMAAAAGLATQTRTADALPLINGSVNFDGDGSTLDSTNTPVAGSVATRLDFGVEDTGTGNGFGVDGVIDTIGATGDLVVLIGASGAIKDLTINPATAPVVDFIDFTVPDFDFTLITMTILLQDDFNIVLSGLGELTLTGYDPTPGTYRLSTTSAGTDFTFTAGVTAAPEPTTLGLLGVGLGALGLALRKRRQRAA